MQISKLVKIENKSEYSKGITIIELIVYIGLLSIFIFVLLDIFVTILNSRLEMESTASLNQDSRYILSQLAAKVTNADAVTLPQNPGDSV